MAALRALLISDRRPGHYALSEGILAAIARRREVETTKIRVRRPAWLPARWLSGLVNAGTPPDTIIKRVYGLEAAKLPKVDLIVSAGGNTLAANVAAARILGVPNIFYGSLRRYKRKDFSLVFTSYAAQVHEPHPVLALKPSSLDPDSEGMRVKQGSVPTIGLVIGGDSGTVSYDKYDWAKLIAFVEAYHRANGTRWVIANSPRTPMSISNQIESLAASKPDCVADFIDVRIEGAGTLHRLFSVAGQVVCTADSSTMLSECVWVRRPVIAVTPRDWALPPNEEAYRSWLEENGWSRSLAIADLRPEAVTSKFSEIVALSANPLDQLAGVIEERLPSLFAST